MKAARHRRSMLSSWPMAVFSALDAGERVIGKRPAHVTYTCRARTSRGSAAVVAGAGVLANPKACAVNAGAGAGVDGEVEGARGRKGLKERSG